MHLSDTTNLVMTAQRMQIFLRSAYYLISIQDNIIKAKTPGSIAELKSNFLGTEFTVLGFQKHQSNQTRTQHGSIIYTIENYEDQSHPIMTIVLPKLIGSDKFYTWNTAKEGETMLDKYTEDKKDMLICLNNKKPVWHNEKPSLSLAFK